MNSPGVSSTPSVARRTIIRDVDSIEFSIEKVCLRPDEVRTPGRPYANVRRIVVIREDKLGDFVLTIPVIAALRETYPSAEIIAVVHPTVAPLARLVRPVDRVVERPGNTLSSVEALRELRADLAVCVSRGWRSAWEVWRAGVERRIGSGGRIYSLLFTRRVVEHRRAGGRHELEYSLSFAHRAGAVHSGVRFPIVVPVTTRRSALEWREQRRVVSPYVVLHPGSGGSCPRWPLSRWLELSNRLKRERVAHVISVGPEDEEVTHLFRGASPATERVPVFAGDLPVLASLLEDAALVVSNSTGPIHLAAALGTPSLAIHAPWATCGVARWGPYAENGRAIVVRTEGVFRWTRRRRRRLGSRLMQEIPVDYVGSVCDAMLHESSRSTP